MEENNGEVIHSSFWANVFKTPTDKSELETTLLSVPLFEQLTNKDISLLSTIIHNRSYVAGEYIFYQGDPGIGLYIIREGEVIVRRNVEGEIVSLATLKEGDFFGELALLDGEKRSASAIAKTDVRVAVIFKPDLDEFIEKYPKRGIKILQGISKIIVVRLRKVNEDHVHLQSKLIKHEGHYGT
ncbi:MAG: cyclic nucleotide-binding domain-containing protein [Ignavibacteriaceae bacterium]